MVMSLHKASEIVNMWKKGKIPRKSIKRIKGRYYIMNGYGTYSELKANGFYYHRGNGRFSLWSPNIDKAKKAKHRVSNWRMLNKGDARGTLARRLSKKYKVKNI